MKKLILALIAALILIPTAYAHAHVLEFNNGIGAVLHIDPQDDPVAGEQTTFYFEFRDQAGQFRAQDCLCKLVITDSANTPLLDTSMNATADDTASTSFTFASRGVYQLAVSGSPKEQSNFSALKLDYTVRVDKGLDTDSPATDYISRAIYLSAGGVIVLIVLLMIRQQVIYTVVHDPATTPKKPRNDHNRKSSKPRV
jgi:hypothetical protein